MKWMTLSASGTSLTAIASEENAPASTNACSTATANAAPSSGSVPPATSSNSSNVARRARRTHCARFCTWALNVDNERLID